VPRIAACPRHDRESAAERETKRHTGLLDEQVSPTPARPVVAIAGQRTYQAFRLVHNPVILNQPSSVIYPARSIGGGRVARDMIR
jgi:hypothetical protein